MPHRSRGLIWAGRVIGVLIIAGLAGYLAHQGLDRADKLGSGIGAVLALAALLAPYLLPPSSDEDRAVVDRSGNATATAGGQASTGITGAPRGPATVRRSGDARADGPGSEANTGVKMRKKSP